MDINEARSQYFSVAVEDICGYGVAQVANGKDAFPVDRNISLLKRSGTAISNANITN
jgi:hypothetical protein